MTKTCRYIPLLTFSHASPSHLTEAGPNQAQGERVEHEGFLDGDLLARYLKMPEMKQQVGHETSQRALPSPSCHVYFVGQI